MINFTFTFAIAQHLNFRHYILSIQIFLKFKSLVDEIVGRGKKLGDMNFRILKLGEVSYRIGPNFGF